MNGKLPVVLEPEEASALLRVPNKRYPTGLRNKAILSIMLNAGLRLSEVINLQPSDVNLSKYRLNIIGGKGKRTGDDRRKDGKDRNVYFPDSVSYLLQEWSNIRPKSKYYFCTLDGKQLSARYIQSMVYRCRIKAGIEKHISPHTLRHTFATQFYRQYENLVKTQMVLGHSKPATTSIYIHLAGSEIEHECRNFRDFV